MFKMLVLFSIYQFTGVRQRVVVAQFIPLSVPDHVESSIAILYSSKETQL